MKNYNKLNETLILPKNTKTNKKILSKLKRRWTKKFKKSINSKQKGIDWEKKIRKTIASGAMWFDKGDIATENFLIEAKYTDKKSFRITEQIISKIWNDALDSNKLPKIVIGIPKNERELFILTCNLHIIKRK